MLKYLWCGVGMVLVCFMIASCKPKITPDVSQAIAEVRQLAAEGQVDPAIARLESLWKSNDYKESMPAILAALVSIEVGADRMDAAQKRFLTVMTESPALAVQAFGIIEEALLARGENQEMVDWAIRLRSHKLGDAALTALARGHIRALAALGKKADIIVEVRHYLPCLSEAEAFGLADGYFQAAVQGRDWEQAEALVTTLSQMMPDSPVKRDAVVASTVSMILARDGWSAAEVYFRRMVQELTDARAAQVLRILGEAMVAAKALTAADALYGFGMVDDKTRPMFRGAAATGWLSVEGLRGSADELVRRLAVLKTREYPSDFIANLISRHYSCLLNKGTSKEFDALNLLLQSLRKGEQGKGLLRQLDGMLLDVSYFREDYEASLEIIERGLVIDDPANKALMICKVNAHIALKKGDYRTSIGLFRKFMEVIATEKSSSIDPVENIQVSPKMILGFNARRIGDIWIKAGSADEAAKAYTEAREHYEDALKEFPDALSGENKKILRELNEIPRG